MSSRRGTLSVSRSSGSGLRAALLVPADLGLVVALGQRGEDGLLDRRGELELRLSGCLREHGLERSPIQVELVRKSAEQRADRLLLRSARLLILGLGGALLL